MSKAAVFEVLEIDRRSRNLKKKKIGDIFTLDTIDHNKDWNYSLPTIVTTSGVPLNNKRIKQIDEFNKQFDHQYGWLFKDLNYDNILIAGGSVIETLLKVVWSNDVDIFIYGLSKEEATTKVEELILHFQQAFKNKIIQEAEKANEDVDNYLQKHYQITSVRNKYSVSLTLGLQTLQIIFRLYKSISQILHGFDMGSSAVGYDGTNIYFTSLGKFSYEYLVNIVDPSRRSTTYEKRLVKYHSRGFNIILADLDISKLPASYLKYGLLEVCELPYFTFSYSHLKGNKIIMKQLLKWGNVPTNEFTHCDYTLDDFNEYTLFYLNLRNLVKETDNYYYYSEKDGLDILDVRPYISESRIIDYYDNLLNRIYNKQEFNIKLFSFYLSEELLPSILTQIFIDKKPNVVADLLDEQKEEIINKLHNIPANTIEWITKNPGSQLTGSFNPIVSDVKDWYGDYVLV